MKKSPAIVLLAFITVMIAVIGTAAMAEGADSAIEAKTLHLVGCMDDTIYHRFLEDHGDVSVTFAYDLLTPEEIAQRMMLKDDSADLYATWMDYRFRSLVRKGYVADLSASSLIAEDIATMYPQIQQALTDGQGKPIAYPYQIYLRQWQVNRTLWREIFGDRPLPRTYDELMDAMLLFERDYAEQYDDVDFAGNFDRAAWVQMLVNAYVEQYGREGEPLTLDAPVLRQVLEKFEQVCDLRRQYQRNMDYLEDTEFIPKTDLFISAGYLNILMDAPSPERLEMTYEEMPGGVYETLPVLLFEEDMETKIPARMMVWFVTPYARNRALAIQYLEYLARASDSRTAYGTHPDRNEPIPYEHYASQHESLTQQLRELEATMEKELSQESLDAVQLQMENVQYRLSILEQNRWSISKAAIEAYRKIAPQLCFFEENPYVMPVGSKSESFDQVESVYRMYAQGRIDLGMFLQNLTAKMNAIYMED